MVYLFSRNWPPEITYAEYHEDDGQREHSQYRTSSIFKSRQMFTILAGQLWLPCCLKGQVLDAAKIEE